MQLTDRTKLFLIATAALLPLLGLAVLLWRRYYREDESNAARRVFKNSAVPLMLRLMVRAFDLAVFVVLQQTLPGVNIGPYALAVLLVGQYLGTFTEFGLGVLLTREVARDPGAARRLFGATLLLRWLLVLVGAAPFAALLIALYSLLGALHLGEAITPVGQQAIWILLLTLIPGAYSSAVTALYNARRVVLTIREVEVLTALAGAHPAGLTGADLGSLVWGEDRDDGVRLARSYVRFLRVKAPGLIPYAPVQGHRYRIAPAEGKGAVA